MSDRFDDLSRAIARDGLSRRQALRRLAGGIFTSVFAAAGLKPAAAQNGGGGNGACAHFCDMIYPPGPQRGQCKSDAAHGQGICIQCGPNAPTGQVVCGTIPGSPVCCDPGLSCCGTTCHNLNTETSNCGACGNVCVVPANATSTCTNGTCGFACQPGFADCNQNAADGCETNTSTDLNNCGACGNTCTAPANAVPVCTGGVCGFVCNTGFSQCGNSCVDTTTDSSNCGACGNVCAGGAACVNGVCTSSNPNPSCAGSTCGNFGACSTNTDCVCTTTAEGGGLCIPGTTSCTGLKACSTSTQCGPGELCVVNSCCGPGVCVPVSLTCPPDAPAAAFASVRAFGPTIASP